MEHEIVPREWNVDAEPEQESVIEPGTEYYRQESTLDQMVRFIQGSQLTSVRSDIATGFWLKRIRDEELFRQEGYDSFGQFAHDVLCIDPPKASRMINSMIRYSKGGDSPILDKKYLGFNKSQLQEMLSFTDAELEEITPDVTVAQLRDMKRGSREPEQEEPEEDIPGQTSFAMNFPEVFPDNYQSEPIAKGKAEFEMQLSDMMSETDGQEGGEIAISQQDNHTDDHAGEATEMVERFANADNTLPEDHFVEINKIVGTALDELDLSVSTYNVLRRAGIDTIEELESKSKDELESVRNMGLRALNEIEEKLKAYHEECATEKQQNSEGVLQESSGEPQVDPNIRYEYCRAFARYLIETEYGWFKEDYTNRVLNVTESEKQIKARFGPDTWYFNDPVKNGSAHVNLFDDYIQFWDTDNNFLLDCEWFYLCSAVQGTWNFVVMERIEEERKHQEKEEPKAPVCDQNEQDCDYNEQKCDQNEQEAVQNETECDQDQENIVPDWYDKFVLIEMIEEEKKTMDIMRDYWEKEKPRTLKKHIMRIKAFEMLLNRMEGKKCPQSED